MSVILLQACAPGAMSSSDFVSYVDAKDHGFIQQREFGNVKYSLKLEPAEYKTLKELTLTNSTINQSNFDSILKEYEGLYYFTFKIESLTSSTSPIKSIAKNEKDIAKIIQYCQSMLQTNFYLESDNGKEACALFHIEDDYHITNYNLVSLAFDLKKLDPNKDFAFVFDDPFFNSGVLKFNISRDLINKLPTLKFS